MKLLLFLLLWPAFAPAQSAVLDTELRRFRAMIDRDTAELAGLLDTSLVYLHSNALLETRAAHLAAIGAGRLQYRQMDREAARLRMFGKTAVVNGVLHAAGTIQEKPFDLRLRYTAVYRKHKRRWLLVNWQSTGMPAK